MPELKNLLILQTTLYPILKQQGGILSEVRNRFHAGLHVRAALDGFLTRQRLGVFLVRTASAVSIDAGSS